MLDLWCMSHKAIINRIRRVRGQLEKLEQAIEQEQPCRDIIPQFLAVRGATNAALSAYFTVSLDECDTQNTEERAALIRALTRL